MDEIMTACKGECIKRNI